MSHRARSFVVAAVVASVFTFVGCAPSSGKGVQLSPAANQAIHDKYPSAKVQTVKQEKEEGVAVYEVKLAADCVKTEVTVTEAGMILEIETVVSVKDLPKQAADAVAKAAGDAKITEVKKQEVLADAKNGKLASPKVTYEIELAKGDKEGGITVAGDGSIIKELKWEEQEKEGKGDKDGKDEEKEAKDGHKEGHKVTNWRQ